MRRAIPSCWPGTVPPGPGRRGAPPFAETLGVPVATTFHGKGVFPDDHPLALGAVGFMRHDYVNFGFDQADVIVAVGYELQEFDPVRINPQWRQEDHPHPPVPCRGRRALRRRRRAARRHRPEPRCARPKPSIAAYRRPRGGRWIRGLLAEELARGVRTTAFPWRRRGSWPNPRCAGSRRHRAGRHRGAEDVDGAAVPNVRAEHLPDLQRPVDHGLDGARRHRREDRPARPGCSSRPATAHS